MKNIILFLVFGSIVIIPMVSGQAISKDDPFPKKKFEILIKNAITGLPLTSGEVYIYETKLVFAGGIGKGLPGIVNANLPPGDYLIHYGDISREYVSSPWSTEVFAELDSNRQNVFYSSPKIDSFDLEVIAEDLHTNQKIIGTQLWVDGIRRGEFVGDRITVTLPTSNNCINLEVRHSSYSSESMYYNNPMLKYRDSIKLGLHKNRFSKSIRLMETRGEPGKIIKAFQNQRIIVTGPEEKKDTVSTDKYGIATFHNLMQGYHEFSLLRIKGYKMSDIHSTFFNVSGNAFNSESNIFLEPIGLPPLLTFKGCIEDDYGAKLEGAKVSIDIEGQNDHHLTTNNVGCYKTEISMDLFKTGFTYDMTIAHDDFHRDLALNNEKISLDEFDHKMVERNDLELIRTHTSYKFNMDNQNGRLLKPRVFFWSENSTVEASGYKLDDFKEGVVAFDVIGPVDFEYIFVIEKITDKKQFFHLIRKDELPNYMKVSGIVDKRLRNRVIKQFNNLDMTLQYKEIRPMRNKR